VLDLLAREPERMEVIADEHRRSAGWSERERLVLGVVGVQRISTNTAVARQRPPV